MTTTKFAPYGVELPAFNPDGRCPKCGHEQVATSHSEPGCTDKECTTCDGEHLRRTCQRCRYAWAEAVADPADPAREPGTVTGCACTDGNQTRAQGGPVGPVVITSPDPVEAYKAVTDEIKTAIRRTGGHSAA